MSGGNLKAKVMNLPQIELTDLAYAAANMPLQYKDMRMALGLQRRGRNIRKANELQWWLVETEYGRKWGHCTLKWNYS